MKRFILTFLTLIIALFPTGVFAATLHLSPSGGSYHVGSTFSVKVLVASDSSINAVGSALSFSNDTLSVQSISKSGSLISFWATEPTYSNNAGTISFEGVSLGTGYVGSGGAVVTIVFKAKSEGDADVTFTSGSVLANDGNGTDVTGKLTGGSYTITPALPAEVKPKTETPAPVATSTPPVPVSDAPIITLGIAKINGEGRAVVFGLTKYPNALSTLYFGQATTTTLRVSVYATADGSFVIPVPYELKPGAYTVLATVSRPAGGESMPSNAVIVRIPHSLSSWAWELVPYLSVGLLILLVLSAVLFLFWYTSLKLMKKQHQLGHETHQAQTALHKSFEVLRKDIVDHLKEIRKAGEVDAGSEKDVLLGLKQDIDDAEDYLKKEIKDIGPEDAK